MKKTKKILSLVLAVLMCFCCIFTTAKAADFVPRVTEPSVSSPYWIHTSQGGLNSCIIASGNSVLPNCVGYAWGRAYEILGSEPDLSRLNAGEWFGINKDKYDSGNGGYPYSTDITKPKLGAVVCWSDSSGAGHVAVIEKINGDQITTSESGWDSARFWTTDRSTTHSRLGQKDNYTFQGYIYLLDDSIQTGDIIEFGSYLGEPITWRCVGIDANGPLMLSEKVLCFKSYDAKGNYANSYRRSNGSNNWAETTLRHWLNSYGEVDWSNRISVPSNENVYYKKGGYDKELGFLSSFSEAELGCIKTVTLKTYLNSADSSLAAGGTSEYNLPYADYADFFIEDMASRGNGKWYINTTDRVFILDPEQTAMCYFNLGEEFTFNPGATDAAFENEKTGLKDRVYYNIWMRVPATQGMSYQNNGATIHTDTIHKVNSGVIANAEDVGVRPAFYLDVDKYNSLSKVPSTPTTCKHNNSVNKPQLDPNCIDIGFTAGVYCNDCETWLSGHEVIAVSDHKDNNGDGKCDTCLKQLSTQSEPEQPKKNIIQKAIDAVKNAINNFINFFKKLFGR